MILVAASLSSSLHMAERLSAGPSARAHLTEFDLAPDPPFSDQLNRLQGWLEARGACRVKGTRDLVAPCYLWGFELRGTLLLYRGRKEEHSTTSSALMEAPAQEYSYTETDRGLLSRSICLSSVCMV